MTARRGKRSGAVPFVMEAPMKPALRQSTLVVAVGAMAAASGFAVSQSFIPAPSLALTTVASASPAATLPQMRASKMIGMSAHDREGKAVGVIKDIVLDADTGRVHYVVLSSGGALGIGEKLHAVPMSRVRVDGKRALALDLGKSDLAAVTTFDQARWPDWSALQDHEAGSKAGSREAKAHLRRASDVLKANVRDSHGGGIGKVEDLLVDIGGGRVQQVVVKFDRAWNPSDKLIALPMSAFADGATYSFKTPLAEGAAPPRNPPPPLALINPTGEPSKGTASAVTPPDGVQTNPPSIATGRGAPAAPLERQPLKTTTSYADDESLVFKGTREQLVDAPAFDARRIGE